MIKIQVPQLLAFTVTILHTAHLRMAQVAECNDE